MKSVVKYSIDIVVGLYRLMQGMYVTLKNMIRPKVTEQYPENRETKVQFERFRGELIMPHTQENNHLCTGCKICEMNCPNGTISITTKMEIDPQTGKEKRALAIYKWDVGSCIFCGLCTASCPQDAIQWSTNFEHSTFTAGKLVKTLNHEGSSLAVKIKTE